jgi:uncharacterized membrane protein
MDTLKNNLNNSSVLPYDVMNLIYEYADPLKNIRKQIENQEYDLDEIMYRRMKKHIIDKCKKQINYYVSGSYSKKLIELNNTNINDVNFKNNILNDKGGYKYNFLWKVKRLTNICGLEPSFQIDYHSQMMNDLSCIQTYNNFSFNLKEFYQEWVKL